LANQSPIKRKQKSKGYKLGPATGTVKAGNGLKVGGRDDGGAEAVAARENYVGRAVYDGLTAIRGFRARKGG
jgi:hypothetical protein